MAYKLKSGQGDVTPPKCNIFFHNNLSVLKARKPVQKNALRGTRLLCEHALT